MLPDIIIAQKFQCGETKAMYLICHGLAPYFKDKLMSKIQDVPYVISFDESLNKVLQEEQMNLQIWFFDTQRQEVMTRFLGAQPRTR